MNQRPGKTHKAALDNGSNDMGIYKFFGACADVLKRNGQEDASFYFEQIKEHMERGGQLSTDPREVTRILGV